MSSSSPSRSYRVPHRLLVALVATVGVVAAACTSASTGTVVQSEVDRAPVARSALADTVAANAALGTDLYHQLARQDQNFSFSPYAISIALAQVAGGAAGSTAAQLGAVQHQSDLSRLQAGLNTLMQQVDTRDGDRQNDVRQGHVTVQIPIALWGQQGTDVEQPFLDGLARWYGSGLRLVDFRSDPTAAAQAIDDWMDDQTLDQLDPVVPAGQVSEATRLLSTTGAYVAAPWDERFDTSKTRPATFHELDGSTEDATTMSIDEPRGLLYDRGDGWQAVMVPYLGRQLAMVVIVPDAGTFSAFESGFDGPELQQILAGLAPTPLDLELPRFQFATQVDLAGALASLGAPALFDPAQASLPGITGDEHLWLAAADQTSYLSADEEGSQASAPTAVRAQPTEAGTPVSVVVDRPFVVAVVDRASGEPLLLGRVVAP